MNKDQFAGQIFLIFEDRNLKVPSLNWIEALFLKIKDSPDDQLNKGFNKVMSISAEEWNKKYGFGGKPAIADWIEFFADKTTFTPEKEASIEVSRIINHAQYYYGNDTVFDNKTTNACIKTYGGLGKINYELFDNYNPKRADRTWVAKELRDIWLDCHSSGQGDFTPCTGNSSSRRIVYVGDKNKCLIN